MDIDQIVTRCYTETMERVIIGFTGPGSGGKGEASEYLKGQGFVYFSLSDILREVATRYGWSHGREVLQNLGDDMRAKEGADVLARMTVTKNEFKHADLVVIDSIRHPDEINFLRDFFDAKIIGVTASPETLFGRMKNRKRPGDPETFEEFLAMQKREMGEEGSTAMQVHKCLELADKVVLNEGTKEDLIINTDLALLELGVGIMRSSKEGSSHIHEHHHHGHEHHG